VAVAALALVFAQEPPAGPPDASRDPRLKRSQIEELLKSDHKKSLEDAGELMKLSEELKVELEKSDRHVLSMTAMKKAEEIEKIAKRIRGRMKRF
jgi:ATP-dependent helicase/DNAse subunit B